MDYHVDSIGGADSNPGNPEYPWRTLVPVHAHSFQPGDVVRFKRGCGWTGGLTINDSGVEGNPITFTAYGVGDKPVFTNPGSSVVKIEYYTDWIILEKLLVRDAKYFGVRVCPGADHNIVRDIKATDVGSGIAVWGEHNLVTRNHIHDLHGNDPFAAVGIWLFDSYNEISYNTMKNCIAPYPGLGMDGGGIEWYGNADGNYVHHNWVQDSDGFLEIGADAGNGSAKDTIVAYNVSVNNGRFSWIHLSDRWESKVDNFRVENNTIVEPGDIPHWVIFGFTGTPDSNTFIARNNILHVDQHKKISNASDFTHDHNLYYLAGGTQLGFTLGQGEEIADPLFVNLAGGDFHLQPESPARSAGIWLGHSFDFDDKPVANPPDCGAYQYQEDTEMTIVEMLRLKATELRVMADEIDAAADTLAAIDVTAAAAVVETQEALEAVQAVEEAL